MKRDDTLWKGILENLFLEFLLFFFENAGKIFDFSKGFQFLDKELEQMFPADQAEYPKFVDKLVKVFTLQGEEQCILVHIEVQGYRDKNFSKRMATYFNRILDKYNQPVTSIAIFSDSNKSFHPKSYEYDFMGTSYIYRFNTYKIIEQDEQELAANPNPFAIIVLTVLLTLKKDKISEDELYMGKLALAKNLFKRKIPVETVRAMMIFLKHYVRFANKENIAKFDTDIEAITENKKTMGIEELILDRIEKKGMEKGRAEGKAEEKKDFIKNLLQNTSFDIAKIATLVGATPAFVKKVKKELEN